MFITNFQNETNLFKTFFVKRCCVLRTDSALPNMEKWIAVSITEDKTVCIIRKLNSSKAYRCDKMSIPMLKICNTAIAGPLRFFCEKCMDTGRYHRLWKSNYCASKKEKQWSNLEKLQA